MNAQSYSSTGTKSATPAKLNKDVFGLEVDNHDLLKQAYLTYQANSRVNLASTLKRGAVRGGGRKPWRQKGTGRARVGSIRSPIWRGGGIVFGPTGIENYSMKMSPKQRKLAVKQALSLSAAIKDKIAVVEDFKLKTPKTKDLAKLLTKIGAGQRVLIISSELSESFILSIRNISETQALRPRSINVFDTLNADSLVITRTAMSELDKWLGEKDG